MSSVADWLVLDSVDVALVVVQHPDVLRLVVLVQWGGLEVSIDPDEQISGRARLDKGLVTFWSSGFKAEFILFVCRCVIVLKRSILANNSRIFFYSYSNYLT